MASLEAAVRSSKKSGGEKCTAHVLAVELQTDKQSLFGYHHGATAAFLKIYMALPTLVPTARGVLEHGFGFPEFPARQYQCFEANNPCVDRCLLRDGHALTPRRRRHGAAGLSCAT